MVLTSAADLDGVNIPINDRIDNLVPGNNGTIIGLLNPETQSRLSGLSQEELTQELLLLLLTKEQSERRDCATINRQEQRIQQLDHLVNEQRGFIHPQDMLITHQQNIIDEKHATTVLQKRRIAEQAETINNQTRTSDFQNLRIAEKDQSILQLKQLLTAEKDLHHKTLQMAERVCDSFREIDNENNTWARLFLHSTTYALRRETKLQAKLDHLETRNKNRKNPRRSGRFKLKKCNGMDIHANCNRELKKILKDRDARIAKLLTCNENQAETVDKLQRTNATLQKAVDELTEALAVKAKTEDGWRQVLESQQRLEDLLRSKITGKNDSKPPDAIASTKQPDQCSGDQSSHSQSQQHAGKDTALIGKNLSGDSQFRDSSQTMQQGNTLVRGSPNKTDAVKQEDPVVRRANASGTISFSFPSKEACSQPTVAKPKYGNSYYSGPRYYAQTMGQPVPVGKKKGKKQSVKNQNQVDSPNTVNPSVDAKASKQDSVQETAKPRHEEEEYSDGHYNDEYSDWDDGPIERKPQEFIPFVPRLGIHLNLTAEEQASLDKCIEIERLEFERLEALKPKLTKREIDLERKKELEKMIRQAPYTLGFQSTFITNQAIEELKELNAKLAREDEEKRHAKQGSGDRTGERSDHFYRKPDPYETDSD